MWFLVSRLYAKAWLRGLSNHRDLVSALGAVLVVVTGLVNWQTFKAIDQSVGSPELALSVVLTWFSIVGLMGFVVMLLLLIFAQLDNSADPYLITLPLKDFDLRLGQLAPIFAAVVVAAAATSVGAVVALANSASLGWLAVVLLLVGVGLQTLVSSVLGFIAYRLTVWCLSRFLRVSETIGSILGVVVVLGLVAGIFMTKSSVLLVPCLPGFWLWRILTGASLGPSSVGVVVSTLLPLLGGYYVLKGVRVRWPEVQRGKVTITWARALPNQSAVHAAVFVLAFIRYPHIGRQLLASAVLGFLLIGTTVTYLVQHLSPEVQGYAVDSLRSFCWLVAGINGGLVSLTMSNMDRPFRWFYDSSPIRNSSLAAGRLSFFVMVAVISGVIWMAMLQLALPVSLMKSLLDWVFLISVLVFQSVLGYITGRLLGHEFDSKAQMTGVGVFLTVAVMAFSGLVGVAALLTRLTNTEDAALVLTGLVAVAVAVGVTLWVDRRAHTKDMGG